MRVAIVAASAELQTALATAIGASSEFEVVAVGSSEEEIAFPADVVLVARIDDADGETPAMSTRAMSRRDIAIGPLLTNRERDVLALLADGLGNKQIAARLGISQNTVKTHLELLFEKLGVSSRTEAVASGVRRGLLLL